MPIDIVNIILDCLIIACAKFAVFISILMIWIMLFHQFSSSADRTAHLLCINMYCSLGIGCAIMFDIYCYTLYGHIHPTTVSFDRPWCYIKCYLFYVSGCSFFYSYLLQAIYRLCRIVFYTKPFLQSFYLYIGGIALQWIFSCLQVLSIYFLDVFKYLPRDYHCQIPLSDLRSLLLGLSMVHSIPITLTTICYVYTIVYIRRRTISIRTTRQRARDRRDLSVLTRVFILLAVMIGSGLPQMGIGIYHHYSGFLPSWATQFQWLTATFSVLCVAVIMMVISPNLQNFFRQSFSSQNEIINT